MNEHDQYQEEPTDGGHVVGEVDAVGSSEVEYARETVTDAHGFANTGVEPGDSIKLRVHEPIKNCHARLLTVIETRMLPRGRGTNDNPKRLVTQYWSPDGALLAEADKWSGPTIEKLERANDRFEDENKRYHGDVLKLRERVRAERIENEKLKTEIAKLTAKKKPKPATKKTTKKKATKKKTTKKAPGRKARGRK